MATIKKSNLVTISPLTSSCTSCATSFYDFSLTDQKTSVEVSQLFCELIDIETEDLRKKMRLPGNTPPKLPFCPQCLLTLNEIRVMNRQLENLGAAVSKLKKCVLSATVTKLSEWSDGNLCSNERGSAITQNNVRFIHEHIRKRCNMNSSDRRGSLLSLSVSALGLASNSYTNLGYNEDESNDIDDDESGSTEYPLFVDIVEDTHNSSSLQALPIPNSVEIFDALSADNTQTGMQASDDDDDENGFRDQKQKHRNGEHLFSGLHLSTLTKGKVNGIRKTGENRTVTGNDNDDNSQSRETGAIVSENEEYEMSEPPPTKKRRAPGFSIRIVPPQDLQDNSPLADDEQLQQDEDSFPDASFALGTQPIEIDFDDPRAQIRENFTMCPICFKYTLREGADTDGHNCEEKSQTAHFQCGYCDLIAHTEKSLVTHMKQHLSQAAQRKILSADSAHAKLLEVFAALSGPYPCPYCDSVFSRKSELIRGHIAAQHGVRLKPFPCSVCRNAFRSKNDLERHFRTHTGERPFSCSKCEKTFTRRHHLTTHETTCKYQRYNNNSNSKTVIFS